MFIYLKLGKKTSARWLFKIQDGVSNSTGRFGWRLSLSDCSVNRRIKEWRCSGRQHIWHTLLLELTMNIKYWWNICKRDSNLRLSWQTCRSSCSYSRLRIYLKLYSGYITQLVQALVSQWRYQYCTMCTSRPMFYGKQNSLKLKDTFCWCGKMIQEDMHLIEKRMNHNLLSV